VLSAVARVETAGIPDVDVSLLDVVAGAAVGHTAVDGVLVVEAAAGRVEFQELVAHLGESWDWRWFGGLKTREEERGGVE
jgi:hypothetical protein